MDSTVRAALGELTTQLVASGILEALWVGGSLATGDYVAGVSDLDLVAVTTRPLTREDLSLIARIHTTLDRGPAIGMDLGCQYPTVGRILDVAAEHPTWTHGRMVRRPVSRVTRAELVLHGYPIVGLPPGALLPTVTAGDIREAARAELDGPWSSAARRPCSFWLVPSMVDLGLTAMARARHALARGELLSKTAAIEQTRAPLWLKEDLRARRRGEKRTSPRWRSGFAAWLDVWRTTSGRSPTHR